MFTDSLDNKPKFQFYKTIIFLKLVLSPSSTSAVLTTEHLTLTLTLTLPFHLKKVTKCFEVLHPQTKCWDVRQCSKYQSKLPEVLPAKLHLSNTSGANKKTSSRLLTEVIIQILKNC